MNKIIVMIGEDARALNRYFYDIPSDKIKDQWYLRKHKSLELYIYLGYSLSEVKYNSESIFLDLEANEFVSKGTIIQYLFFPSSQKLGLKQDFNFQDFALNTNKKLTLLYDNQSFNNLEFNKKQCQTQKAFHIRDLNKNIESIFQENQLQKLNSSEILMLIGGQGVGKTNLFQKIACKQSKTEFERIYFGVSQNYCLIDSPSLDMDSDASERDIVIQKFQQFFQRNQDQISTIFLLITFDRFDTMKTNFYSIFKHLQPFSQKLKVIVTGWENCQQEQREKLEKQITHFIVNIIHLDAVLFIDNLIDKEQLEQQLISHAYSQKGIQVEGTIFSFTKSKQEKDMEDNFQVQLQSIELNTYQGKLNQGLKKQSEIKDQIQILNEQREEHRKRIKEIDDNLYQLQSKLQGINRENFSLNISIQQLLRKK